MSKFLFVFCFVIGLTVNSAQASTEKTSTAATGGSTVALDSSYFEQLGTLFQSGAVPQASRLLNVLWSGRCFQKKAPTQAVNAAYAFRQKALDVGPIGNTPVYEAASFWKPSESASYFDTQSYATATRGLSFYEVQIRDQAIQISYSTGISRLRVSNEYLVEEVSSTNSGEIDIRCYYFISNHKK